MPHARDHGDSEHGHEHISPRVLVFYDYACPFCYLDWPRFKRLRAEHDVELFLVPYELRPLLPAEGVPISQIGAAHSEKVEEHMRRMAREGGLDFILPDFMPNTHAALNLSEYGRDIVPDAHEALHESIFAAYNGRAENIGDPDLLVKIAEQHGLDGADVRAAIEEDRYGERLHQFYHLGLAMGITATPAALICNELLIGSRPYALLARSLEHCLVSGKTLEEGADLTRDTSDDGYQSHAEGEPPSITR